MDTSLSPGNNLPASGLSGPRTALLLMQQALAEATERHCDAWQFAVDLKELRRVGVSLLDLRALLSQGFAEHAEERPRRESKLRLFLPLNNLSLPEGACFVLTMAGQDYLHQLPGFCPAPVSRAPDLRRQPRWDRERRELFLGELLVKRFRVPAHNQEQILDVLEEENWPTRIDDPLRPSSEGDAASKLRDTIKALNRKQVNRVLRFEGDGTGRAVLWRILPVERSDTARPSPDLHRSNPCATPSRQEE